MAAGAAAIGSRRLTVLVELDEPPKGLLPAKVALTGKAAPAVHWRCTRRAAFGAPDITGA
jgi:hypothetical protein